MKPQIIRWSNKPKKQSQVQKSWCVKYKYIQILCWLVNWSLLARNKEAKYYTWPSGLKTLSAKFLRLQFLPALDGMLLRVSEVDVGGQQDAHRVRVAAILGRGSGRRRGHLSVKTLSFNHTFILCFKLRKENTKVSYFQSGKFRSQHYRNLTDLVAKPRILRKWHLAQMRPL